MSDIRDLGGFARKMYVQTVIVTGPRTQREEFQTTPPTDNTPNPTIGGKAASRTKYWEQLEAREYPMQSDRGPAHPADRYWSLQLAVCTRTDCRDIYKHPTVT